VALVSRMLSVDASRQVGTCFLWLGGNSNGSHRMVDLCMHSSIFCKLSRNWRKSSFLEYSTFVDRDAQFLLLGS
jgi:hypothetical protein